MVVAVQPVAGPASQDKPPEGLEAAVAEVACVQAGREVRIIVKPEEIDEYAANQLASDIAHKIEESLDYPGQIKVCVVRETRSIDYAR